jgi:xanthine dehydrogenase YagR molybdenum-binding subunit
MAIDVASPATLPSKVAYIGKALDRKDGPAKVTGGAKYAAEFSIPKVVHAVAFCSTIARGRVTNIDTREAEKLPGVLAVITARNADKYQKGRGQVGQSKPPLQDDEVHFAGQYLGLVVAEELEQAIHARDLIKISYHEDTPNLDPDHPIEMMDHDKYSRGDADAAAKGAQVRVEQTYTIANEYHNPMEMHATIAKWDGSRLTLWDATQNVSGVRGVVATTLGISPELVRVIDPFVGGGFGCKGSVWPNSYLAASAARKVGRPVKLMLTRHQMFSQVGYRPHTNQKITLACDAQGKLQATTHDNVSQTCDFQDWVESSTRVTQGLYQCANLRTSQKTARINAGTPTQMRAPGQASGNFALESAMDELALALNVDPLALRLANYADTDQSGKKPKPYTSKSLRECYQTGAERFGWSQRNPKPRSMREGDELIGFGMATATYPAEQRSAQATVRLMPGGTAIVSSAAHDLGTGTYTILAQIAGEALGISPEKIKVEIGDTLFPFAPGAGGSTQAVTVGSAVLATAQDLIRSLAEAAVADEKSPMHGRNSDVIIAQNGNLVLKTDESVSEPLQASFDRNGNMPVAKTGQASREQGLSDRFGTASFGAQFAEVRVDEALGQIRVSRWVGVFAAGRVLNAKTARSQLMGGIVMGVGMGLLEEGIYDPTRGLVVNSNLADYLVPLNPDIPSVDVILLDEKDEHINALGAKGMGELGITGAAAALANAVYHATGKRFRDLPITADKLFA